MKTIIIFLLLLLVPCSASAYSVEEFYLRSALIPAGISCIKEMGLKCPSMPEIDYMNQALLMERKNMNISPDVTIDAMFNGSPKLREKMSCKQIVDLYVQLFRLYGLTGNLVRECD